MKEQIPLKKIGIFDSGIGGISIIQKIMHFPGFQLIYCADTARVPYGKRSQEEIQQFADQAIQFFLIHNIEIVIIACHTVATNALEFLKKKFPQLHFIDVVDLVVEQVKSSPRAKKVGILGTMATIKTEVHKKKLLECNPDLQIFTQACPRLASAIEKDYDNKSKLSKLVDFYLQPLLKANIDTLILGCTHYALIQDSIQKLIGPTIHLVSAENSIKNRLEPFLKPEFSSNLSIQWFITGNKALFRNSIHSILTLNLKMVNKISLPKIAV